MVQLAEIADILESRLPLVEAREIEESLLMTPSVAVLGVGEEDYLEAFALAREKNIGVNDAVACVIMRREGIGEVYSFDRDFDLVEWVERVTA